MLPVIISYILWFLECENWWTFHQGWAEGVGVVLTSLIILFTYHLHVFLIKIRWFCTFLFYCLFVCFFTLTHQKIQQKSILTRLMSLGKTIRSFNSEWNCSIHTMKCFLEHIRSLTSVFLNGVLQKPTFLLLYFFVIFFMSHHKHSSHSYLSVWRINPEMKLSVRNIEIQSLIHTCITVYKPL